MEGTYTRVNVKVVFEMHVMRTQCKIVHVQSQARHTYHTSSSSHTDTSPGCIESISDVLWVLLLNKCSLQIKFYAMRKSQRNQPRSEKKSKLTFAAIK